MHPDPESTLQQPWPLWWPILVLSLIPACSGRKFLGLASLARRSSSVGAYGGGASSVGGAAGGCTAFDILKRFLF